MSRDAEVLHDSAGHDAQCGPWIYLDAIHLRRSDITCKVQGSIMLPFDLHISAVKVMQGAFWEVWRQFSTSSFFGTWVIKPQRLPALLVEPPWSTLIVLEAHTG